MTDLSRHVTGQVLRVDGGQLMGWGTAEPVTPQPSVQTVAKAGL